MAQNVELETLTKEAEQAAKTEQTIREAEQAARIDQLRRTQRERQITPEDALSALEDLEKSYYGRWRKDLQSGDDSLGFVSGNVRVNAITQVIEFARQQLINQDPNLYVLQDSRSYADNQLLFWAKDAAGYTTDLNQAHRFTHEEALEQERQRATDIPHRVGDLLQTTAVTVDRDQLNSSRVMQAESRSHRKEQADPLTYTTTTKDVDARIEAIRQRDMLGKAIHDAAAAAGLVEPNIDLTGPQLMMLADDLGALAADHKPGLPDFDAIKGKRIDGLTPADAPDGTNLETDEDITGPSLG
ncbi:hypothetical protein [Marinobacter subterrani]|uniref:hypothetical protein n=1 Tax=Marinobacter subterrani TaxID=1658765 RepID=UPI0023569F9F|nr:hypothetical protein [Marinobacter subterrani]